MNKHFLPLLLAFVATAASAGNLPKLPARNINFIVLSDSGDRDSTRREAAKAMAVGMNEAITRCNIDFVAHTGDQIHDNGAKSSKDPEWKFKLLDIFSGDKLQSVEWHGVPGNHEYRGNPDAVAQFSDEQEWWESPSRYYSYTETLGNGETVLFLYTDTTPLVDKYVEKWSKGRYDKDYPKRELAWADSVLRNSDARWKIVLGHHPVFAMTDKTLAEKTDMQYTLLPVMEEGNVDLYINGHIHDFQHLKTMWSDIHFVTNASGIRTRKPEAVIGTLYCAPGPGYMICSVSHSKIKFFFVHNDGEVIYSYTIKKQQ